MTQVTDEMVEAFMDGYTAQDTAMAARGDYSTHRESVRAGIAAALATPTPAPVVCDRCGLVPSSFCSVSPDCAPVAGEPVAWQLWDHFGVYEVTTDYERADAWKRTGAKSVPLYTHPAPAPTACADRGMCEMHERERRELLAQETIMGQRIMELEAQLATATADAGRLDWLQRNAIRFAAIDPENDGSVWELEYMNPADIEGDPLSVCESTLLEAIDAARAGAQGGGEG